MNYTRTLTPICGLLATALLAFAQTAPPAPTPVWCPARPGASGFGAAGPPRPARSSGPTPGARPPGAIAPHAAHEHRFGRPRCADLAGQGDGVESGTPRSDGGCQRAGRTHEDRHAR